MSKATDNFVAKRWGVFNHYLYGMQNGNWDMRNPSGRITDWNTCVDEFDTDKLAYNLHKMGAGYYCITLMQGSRYICAPNETFNRLTGMKPGEACSLRDLPEDLYRSLSKYGIDLFLYYVGDGPHLDKEIAPSFLSSDGAVQVDEEFVRKWASVLQDFAERYGDKVKGWWIDGCYRYIGYTDEMLEYYHRAIKAGNPDALVACNVTGTGTFGKGLATEEFICGEKNDFDMLPLDRIVDGTQSHILAPLGILRPGFGGGAWAFDGCKRDKDYMLNYIRRAIEIGTPVTVDIVVYRDGSFAPEQQELLTYVGNHL